MKKAILCLNVLSNKWKKFHSAIKAISIIILNKLLSLPVTNTIVEKKKSHLMPLSAIQCTNYYNKLHENELKTLKVIVSRTYRKATEDKNAWNAPLIQTA